MQRDEILRLAREAGIPIETDWAGRPSTLVIKDGGTYLRGIDELERFAALIAAHERNRICTMLDGLQKQTESHNYYGFIRNLIREMK